MPHAAYDLQDRGNLGPFDDEESLSFYSSLPDLHALVPSILLAKGQEQETKDKGAATDVHEDEAAAETLQDTNGAADIGERRQEHRKLSAKASCNA